MRIRSDRQSGAARESLMQKTIRPERVMALGFFAVILLGTLLLSLPIAAATGLDGKRESIGVFRALFTATSATCVTGLTVVETGTAFSAFGKAVVIALIQIGGLGFMVFATLAMVALGRRISLRNRRLIGESMNMSSLGGLVRLTLAYTALALIIELIGACLLSIRLIPMLGVKKGILYSLFHSVSAFCNAGFDIFGTGSSIVRFQTDPLILLTFAALVVLGGLGFSVISECVHLRRDQHKLSLHAKLVLTLTASLLALGTILILALEWSNPATLGNGAMGAGDKFVNAFFQSVTLRTAGFDSIGQAGMSDSSKLFSIILMFIGASPASTGGGIKTTTIAAAILVVLSVVRGQENVKAFGKRISKEIARRALAIFFIALSILIVSTALLSVIEQNREKPLIDLMFEAASAFSTTGLSCVGSSTLSVYSQAILILLMYFGRVGPLTIAYALASRMEKNASHHLTYPEEKIMIG